MDGFSVYFELDCPNFVCLPGIVVQVALFSVMGHGLKYIHHNVSETKELLRDDSPEK